MLWKNINTHWGGIYKNLLEWEDLNLKRVYLHEWILFLKFLSNKTYLKLIRSMFDKDYIVQQAKILLRWVNAQISTKNWQCLKWKIKYWPWPLLVLSISMALEICRLNKAMAAAIAYLPSIWSLHRASIPVKM